MTLKPKTTKAAMISKAAVAFAAHVTIGGSTSSSTLLLCTDIASIIVLHSHWHSQSDTKVPEFHTGLYYNFPRNSSSSNSTSNIPSATSSSSSSIS